MKRYIQISLIIMGSLTTIIAQKLPDPTGSHRVGTTVFHFTNRAKADTISRKVGQFRELMIQVWYPGDTSAVEKITAPYLPDPAVLKAFLDEQYNFQSPSVIESLKNVRTSAVLDIPVSEGLQKMPLLIFSPGLGEPRSNYTALSQELASHGYIVVSVDHPYGGFTVLPDGRILSTNADDRGSTPEGASILTEEWAQDASFIVSRLISTVRSDSALMKRISKKIDFKKVGMLGHSLGGAAALESCRADPRFKACADLDGAPFGRVREVGIQRPTLIMRNRPIYSDEDLAKKGRTRQQWEQLGRDAKKMWISIRPRNKKTPLYMIELSGAGHMSFSDSPFTMPDTITRFGGRIIDAHLSFEIISAYVRDFFNRYLRGERSRLLDNLMPSYREALIEKMVGSRE